MLKTCKFEQRLTSYLFKFIKYAYSIYRDLTGCYRWWGGGERTTDGWIVVGGNAHRYSLWC